MEQMNKTLGLNLTIIGVILFGISTSLLFLLGILLLHIALGMFAGFITSFGLIHYLPLTKLPNPKLLGLILTIIGVILIGVATLSVLSTYYTPFGLQIMIVFPFAGPLLTGFGLILLFLSMTKLPIWKADQVETQSVIEVAKVHSRITIGEISEKSGVSSPRVSEILYKAINQGALYGTIEDDAYVRSQPASRAPVSGVATRICPYCGAKTRQGRLDCQKCGFSYPRFRRRRRR